MLGPCSGGGQGAKFGRRASRVARPTHHPAGRAPDWGAGIPLGGVSLNAPRVSGNGESVAVRSLKGQPNRRLELAARVH